MSKETIEVFLEQIPEGYTTSDYPKETVFVLDDSKPKRDPATFQLLRSEARPKVFPEDVQKMLQGLR